MYEAILFDLDGTLLPMTQEDFTTGYFKELSKLFIPMGVEPNKLIETIWAGTKAMMKNDGSKMNDEVFWEMFKKLMPDVDFEVSKKICDGYYTTDFHKVKSYTNENPYAKETILVARSKAEKVILATNPVFPRDGQLSRISWIGLNEDDFDLITDYESDRFCKPNPDYFLSVCERMQIDPSKCLMIGNDVKEDMITAKAAGLDTYLVTDYIIPCEGEEWDGKKGTYEEMLAMLKAL